MVRKVKKCFIFYRYSDETSEYDVENNMSDQSDLFFEKTPKHLSEKETIKLQKKSISVIPERVKHLHEKAIKHYSIQCCKNKCL